MKSIKNIELRDIVLDGFNRSILRNVKSKIKSNYRVFLCKRRSAENEIIAFHELTEKGAFFRVDDNSIYNYIVECYLKNVSIQDKNKYFAPICSKVGCLGVILFEANSQEGLVVTVPSKTYIEKSMSALGQSILSNLCDIETTANVGDFEDKIAQKRSCVFEYVPFASRRNCVCMFINIKDFANIYTNPNLSENDIFYKLQVFSEKIKDIANTHFGIVNYIFGGGALVIFNVLLYEDIKVACHRAICAAVKIRKEIKNFHVDSLVGIGSNTGTTFFFDFGNPRFPNYTCFGQIVSKTKKIEDISGKNAFYDNGKLLATDSEHIMISKSIYVELDNTLQSRLKCLNIPKNQYNEELYGLPNESIINLCDCSRSCLECTKIQQQEKIYG